MDPAPLGPLVPSKVTFGPRRVVRRVSRNTPGAGQAAGASEKASAQQKVTARSPSCVGTGAPGSPHVQRTKKPHFATQAPPLAGPPLSRGATVNVTQQPGATRTSLG